MRVTCSLLTGYNYNSQLATLLIFFLSMSGQRIAPMNPGGLNVHFYSATKYAVTALTEGVRRELRAMNSNVRVTVRDIIS